MTKTGAVILVEGRSDEAAVRTLARRFDLDLGKDGVSVVVMGGASPFVGYLESLLIHQAFDGIVAGLCDAGEVADVQRGMARVGSGSADCLGLFVCEPDLEGEMISALGADAVEAIFEEQGELKGFRIMQNQPAWRGRPIEDQVHRFLGIRSGRKVRYGRLLAEAVDLGRVPEPLNGLLNFVSDPSCK